MVWGLNEGQYVKSYHRSVKIVSVQWLLAIIEMWLKRLQDITELKYLYWRKKPSKCQVFNHLS